MAELEKGLISIFEATLVDFEFVSGDATSNKLSTLFSAAGLAWCRQYFDPMLTKGVITILETIFVDFELVADDSTSDWLSMLPSKLICLQLGYVSLKSATDWNPATSWDDSI